MKGHVVSDGLWAYQVCPQCKARGPKVPAAAWRGAEPRAISRGWKLWSRPRALRSVVVCPSCARALRSGGGQG